MKKFCLLVAFSFSVINLFADVNPNFDGKRFAEKVLKKLKKQPVELQEQFATRWENFSQERQANADKFLKVYTKNPGWAEQLAVFRQQYSEIILDERNHLFFFDSWQFQDIFEKIGFERGVRACKKGRCKSDKWDEIDIAHVELVREFDQFVQQWRQEHPKDQNAPAQRV
jgi:hypothetical protein